MVQLKVKSILWIVNRCSEKMDLSAQMDWKSAQLKNESKREPFSAPADAQENANGTAINAFEVRLMMQFRVHLIIHLELYLKVHFKI